MPLRLIIGLGLAALLLAILMTWSTKREPEAANSFPKPVGTSTLSHGDFISRDRSRSESLQNAQPTGQAPHGAK